MHLILLVQSGDDGPVKVVLADSRSFQKTVAGLQHGNPEWLHLRAVLDGDERLEAHLHSVFAAWRRTRGWYAAGVLEQVPGDVAYYSDHDEEDEQRRLAAARITDPAGYE